MSYRLILGHALEKLSEVETESIQTIVTSPPYLGLRDYRTESAIFPGAIGRCKGDKHEWDVEERHNDHLRFRGHNATVGNNKNEAIYTSGHTQAARCIWCGAWKGHLGLEPEPDEYIEHLVQIFREARRCLKNDGTLWVNIGDTYAANRDKQISQTLSGEKRYDDVRYNGVSQKVPEGMKPKDLIGIPWMLAFALRKDGWWLRSDIIWAKPNPTPESVKDRPTKSHEYLFLLSKNSRYHFDYQAIRESAATVVREQLKYNLFSSGEGEDAVTDDMRNKRDVWTVAVSSNGDEEHYAQFPERLIEPCILAGSREGDLVADIFNGSGTTGVVSVRHNRHYLGIELLPANIELSERKIGRELNKFPLLR